MIEKVVSVHGVKGNIVKLLWDIYSLNWIKVDDGLSMSERILQSRGVLQGDSLSPLMFIMYTADLPRVLKDVSDSIDVICYADDLVFFLGKDVIFRRLLLCWQITVMTTN